MQVEEEARLIALARKGDVRAFGRLVDAHQAPVRAFLRRLVGNTEDAEDLSQEAFARTWEVLHRFDGRSSFRTFVGAVAYRYWLRSRRAFIRRSRREQSYHVTSEMQSEIAPSAEAKLALRRAMEALPEDVAAALALCLGQDFSHAEAAEVLGIPLGTVKSHVARGRTRLHEALGTRESIA